MSTSEEGRGERGGRGYHEYIGGCSVQQGDIMSTSGGYREHIGGCSVHWGCHEYIREIS